MIVGQFSFSTASNVDRDAVEEAALTLLYALRNNGQVLGGQWPLAWTKDCLTAHLILPAYDSLESLYASEHVSRAYEKLSDAGIEKVQIQITGERAEDFQHAQHLPSAYILFTTFLADKSPLTCGDCISAIPLYSIPPTDNHGGYSDIRSWEADYKACDTLQIHSRSGEAFATRQMSLPTSSLSQQGREICTRIETLTGIPTYYYLYRYVRRTTHAREQERRCPVCGGEWLLSTPWHRYDFRCDTCRLVSTVSF